MIRRKSLLSKLKLTDFPHRLYLETALLCSMLITLLVPSVLSPIMIWSEISPLLFVRAFVWLLGLSILPGACILRLRRISKNLSETEKIAIEINLSLILVGLATLIFYARTAVISLPWFILSILAILDCTYWFGNRIRLSIAKPKITKWQLLLMAETAAIVIMAFFVQFNQQYTIPGDNWVAVKPTVEVISQRNVYESFMTAEYPMMFGFILAGLSVCSGLPVVNTYVFVFPLVTLNILSFFTLVKIVFNTDDKVSIISSILYGFGGGLGFLIQAFVFHGTKDFWSLSFLSQDMYFFAFFWNSIQFSYKSLALTLAYTSIILFVIGIRLENRTGKMVAITLSSLSMLFSFLIHMLEPMIFAPVVLAITYVYQKGRNRYTYFGSFAIITILLGYTIDSLMSGFYTSISIIKIRLLLSTVNIENLLTYFALLPTAVCAAILGRHFFSKHLDSLNTSKPKYCRTVKLLIVAAVASIYISGLWFWASTPPSLEVSSIFPWYRYVTRYGFVGGLAIFGLAITAWKKRWFIIASFWCIFVILLGSLWWGERSNAYLFPMLTLLAAFALEWIWTIGNRTKLHISVKTGAKLKLMARTLIIVVLALSFTSVIYGAGYYTLTEAPTSYDEARAFAWVHQNTPENATVLVPQTYVISKGIFTISDRQVYQNVRLATALSPSSFTNLTESLNMYNIRYAITIEDIAESSDMIKCLLRYSKLVFQSGKVKVFELPLLRPPSQEYTVAIVEREAPLGLGSASSFGWVDDEFTDNWTYVDVNASSNGEVLTYRWTFHTGDAREPSIKKNIPPVNTNSYPYIVVKYRNTAETTTTAENNIGQIITLINETGYPQGFVKNFYLPISKGDAFDTFVSRLPENQSIASVSIWMRNYKQLNGTINLQIDYIGFASNDLTFEPEFQTRFLSMALPSLWSKNYFIFSNFDEAQTASIIVSLYDKSVPNIVKNLSNPHNFVFLNASADLPSWGTEWRIIKPEIISGYLEDKKVIIVGVNDLRGNISNLAEDVYEEIVR